MILPSKHLSEDRALISVGSRILIHLENPRSVSELWEKLRASPSAAGEDYSSLTFDWFTLAMSFLFAIRAVEMLDDGLIAALRSPPFAGRSSTLWRMARSQG